MPETFKLPVMFTSPITVNFDFGAAVPIPTKPEVLSTNKASPPKVTFPVTFKPLLILKNPETILSIILPKLKVIFSLKLKFPPSDKSPSETLSLPVVTIRTSSEEVPMLKLPVTFKTLTSYLSSGSKLSDTLALKA